MNNRNIGYLMANLIIFLSVVFAVTAHAQTPAKLSDYWAGNAQWDLVTKWTNATPNGASGNTASKIKIVNGVWYLFQREFESTPANCNQGLGIRIYSSTNQGTTWAITNTVITPVAGTDFSCQIADGDAFYDAATNKWRALYQCLDASATATWKGCYFEHAGADLTTGSFDYASAARAHAVITPGLLWKQICNIPGDTCYQRNVVDEGTFDIFQKDSSGYFWVAFHGFSNPNGFRGIAKTTDFINWVAGNTFSNVGVPTDATMSVRDGQSWREGWNTGGNIGAGNGSIVQEDTYFYELTEMADINLGCTAGQHWDFGLFRSSNLASTQWDQFPLINPIVYSSTAIEPIPQTGGGTVNAIRPCNLQYGQLIRDTSSATPTIYMKIGRDTYTDDKNSGSFLYRLDKSTNLLKNGNLWTADTSNWQRLPSGSTTPNYAVYRWPNLSPDGNQFLATNCSVSGSACVPGSSFYQDVPATAYLGRSVTFGGKFATAAGSGGSPQLVLFQLDANGAALASTAITLSALGTSYTSFSSAPIAILTTAKTLRYQFYHSAPGITYFAGNMFINLQ
jgi:hypothetical protein